MLELNKLIAFSQDFVSFLTERIDLDNIKNIILFGSVSRGESDEDSDIDIFIDLANELQEFKDKIEQARDEFYKSAKFKDHWSLLGINNQIKLTIGKLEQWSDLLPSIISNGITLYGKFKAFPQIGEHKTLFVWENIKPESTRVLLNKQLFGYKHTGKSYPGVVQKYNCQRLGKGMIMVPIEHSNLVEKVFRKLKIGVRIKKVIEY